MDTLCIPVDTRYKEYRNKAIRLMGKIYHDADAVLVLDKELCLVDGATSSFLEIGLRILVSGWMKRLWTLQEGAFALSWTDHGIKRGRRLYFQMRDGPFCPGMYGDDELGGEKGRIMMHEHVFLPLDFADAQMFRATVSSQGTWFVFRALNGRLTSKAEDVPVCAASLLGLDLSPILAAPDPHRRVAALYQQMPVVPENLLWIHDPTIEKLSVAPFRWAPLHITSIPSGYLSMGGEDIKRDDRGAHACYAGFILDVTAFDRQVMYLLVSQTPGGEQDVEPHRMASKRDSQCSHTATGSLSPTTPKLAIILKPSLLESGSDLSLPNAAVLRIESDGREIGVGADVDIEGTIIGYGRCLFDPTSSEIAGLIQQYEHTRESGPALPRATYGVFVDSGLLAIPFEEWRLLEAPCTRVGEHQRWCIT